MHDPFISASSARQPSTPPIFLRDFAYPDSARVVLTERMRMASERSVAKSLARDFAGYVVPSRLIIQPIEAGKGKVMRHVAFPGHACAVAFVVVGHWRRG